MTSDFRKIAAHSLLAISLLASTAACTTVGPDYNGPPTLAPTAEARGSFLRADGSAVAEAPLARWWETLNDPLLDRLISDALANSPNIAVATAKVTQARAGLAANKTAAVPTVGTSLSAPYINVPADLLSQQASGGRTDIQRYSLGFDASWELDLFGGTRRKVEAASARAEAAEAGLADAQVSLSAEVARAYVGLRTRQAVLQILEQQGAIDAQLVDLAEQRYRMGTAPMQPLEQARAQAAQSQAQIASARAEIVVLQDQLAVLTGREPGALDAELARVAPIPMPPAEVAVGDPALVLRNRPDIRIAERQLAAADADVGVSIADKFPKVSFMGLLGTGGDTLGSLFDPASLIGLVLPRISWTLFDGGRAQAKVDQSKGALAEAEARYRAAVLAALGDAETALTRFGSDRIELGKAIEAEGGAARAAQLQHQRAAAGTAPLGDALAADRQRLQLALATANARAELTSDFIAVNKALGLGWQVPTEPAGAQ
ncbi:MAG: efflux transporter outer membrane subunit [Sphingomonadales bacterium]|nr:efflux transporter outer membrane subunit [Sphingomonadales bacterium]MBD3773299.1 efflux transporter outer membrane subunit [Paracoccaceae bacterium]